MIVDTAMQRARSMRPGRREWSTVAGNRCHDVDVRVELHLIDTPLPPLPPFKLAVAVANCLLGSCLNIERSNVVAFQVGV